MTQQLVLAYTEPVRVSVLKLYSWMSLCGLSTLYPRDTLRCNSCSHSLPIPWNVERERRDKTSLRVGYNLSGREICWAGLTAIQRGKCQYWSAPIYFVYFCFCRNKGPRRRGAPPGFPNLERSSHDREHSPGHPCHAEAAFSPQALSLCLGREWLVRSNQKQCH